MGRDFILSRNSTLVILAFCVSVVMSATLMRSQADSPAKETSEELEMEVERLKDLIGLPESASSEDNVRVPHHLNKDGTSRDLTLFERIRYLEHKVDGASDWAKDPQLYTKEQYHCSNQSTLGSDHHICFDHWEESLQKHIPRSRGLENCIVYDLGIRANPEFGVNMMKDYGCAIRAYDPSPTSQEWWAKEAGPDLKGADSKYKFHAIGAGGVDGNMELWSYNWQQVSIYKAEDDLTVPNHGNFTQPQSYHLPVETLATMMHNNGDSYIDVLKIDIEGSEYLFMQQFFDKMGCPPVGQIAIEWHNFALDERYGSAPELNTLVNLLNSCGFKAFIGRDHFREDPEWSQGGRKLPPTRITLASYCKDCWQLDSFA